MNTVELRHKYNDKLNVSKQPEDWSVYSFAHKWLFPRWHRRFLALNGQDGRLYVERDSAAGSAQSYHLPSCYRVQLRLAFVGDVPALHICIQPFADVSALKLRVTGRVLVHRWAQQIGLCCAATNSLPATTPGPTSHSTVPRAETADRKASCSESTFQSCRTEPEPDTHSDLIAWQSTETLNKDDAAVATDLDKVVPPTSTLPPLLRFAKPPLPASLSRSSTTTFGPAQTGNHRSLVVSGAPPEPVTAGKQQQQQTEQLPAFRTELFMSELRAAVADRASRVHGCSRPPPADWLLSWTTQAKQHAEAQKKVRFAESVVEYKDKQPEQQPQ